MHLGHQGCTDIKELAQMPARLAFRTILGSTENSAAFVAFLPETGIEPIDQSSVKAAILTATTKNRYSLRDSLENKARRQLVAAVAPQLSPSSAIGLLLRGHTEFLHFPNTARMMTL